MWRGQRRASPADHDYDGIQRLKALLAIPLREAIAQAASAASLGGRDVPVGIGSTSTLK